MFCTPACAMKGFYEESLRGINNGEYLIKR